MVVAFGVARARADTSVGWFAALGISIVLGVFLTFAQVFLNTFCIETLKRCVSRGDVNMSYWFQSFMAIPVYWLCIAGISRLKTP